MDFNDYDEEINCINVVTVLLRLVYNIGVYIYILLLLL